MLKINLQGQQPPNESGEHTQTLLADFTKTHILYQLY